MQETPRGADLERAVKDRLARGDVDGAVELAMRGYGPEVFSFLVALHRDEDDACEVFSRFAEGLWRGIGTFAWESSLRTWAYAIARKASLKHRRDARRRAARFALLPDGSTISRMEQLVRTETLQHLRSEVRTRIMELRDSLDPEERELLMLRIDRELSWNELALVMQEEGEAPLEGEALKRVAARLRKRFQGVKEKLRELARREGLL
jgi:RNA polymerase sigma-70 factor (ECF subfamily)